MTSVDVHNFRFHSPPCSYQGESDQNTVGQIPYLPKRTQDNGHNMPPASHLALCKNRNSNLFSVWSGPSRYRVDYATTKFKCGVWGCSEILHAFQSAKTSEIYLGPHKCISNCVHASKMREWTQRFVEKVRYTVRVCPTCKMAPTRSSSQSLPLPPMRIYGSCLLVKIPVHKAYLIVNFAAKNWPSDIPVPSKEEGDWTVIRMTNSDPIPRILTKGANKGCVSKKECKVCELGITFPLRLYTTECCVCAAPYDPTVILPYMETPVVPKCKDTRRQFVDPVTKATHVFVAASAARVRTLGHATYVWRLPIPPSTEPTLELGSVYVDGLCPDCTPPHVDLPPQGVFPGDTELDAVTAAFVMATIDGIDAGPDKRACHLCQLVLPLSDLTWYDRVPATRFFTEPPSDGCYLCASCYEPCTRCGTATVVSPDHLCDKCHDALAGHT